MLDNQLDKERLRQKVEAEVSRNKAVTRWIFFVVNLGMYLLFMALMWGMVLTNPVLRGLLNDNSTSSLGGMLIMPTVGWATGILFHFLSVLTTTRMMDKSIRRRVMANVIGEQVFESLTDQMSSDNEKAKRNGQHLRLGDDGELVAADEATSDDSAPRKKMAGKS